MSKKYLFILCVCLTSVLLLQAQDKFYTKSGKIEFHSRASLEDIDARNKTVSALIDSKTGTVQFSVLMKSFEFEKALMQEHFNSDYAESDKYPKAEFKGTITNNTSIDYSKDGSYAAKVKGQLTLHGVTRNLETMGMVKVEGGKLDITGSFPLMLADYNIKIQSVVKNKIAKTIDVVVDCKMERL